MIDLPAFQPHPLLFHDHLMTASVVLPRPRARALLRGDVRRVFATAPCTQVAGWMSPYPDPRRPFVVLVHGLSGHAGSTYLQGLAAKGQRAGLGTLRLNVRSCGGTEHLSPSLFHAGLTEDLRSVLEELRGEGHRQVFLVGYSLGGNMVLRLAGELAGRGPEWLAGVAAVSPALDLTACSRAIDEAPGMAFYRRCFLRDLARKMRRKAAAFPGRYDLAGLDRLRTIREFDERFVAPPFGFCDATDYYHRASARRVAAAIGVPTLIVQAEDDRFVPFESVRCPEVTGNAAIQVLLTRRGGHCAFLAARPGHTATRQDGDRHWAEERVLQFLELSDPLP